MPGKEHRFISFSPLSLTAPVSSLIPPPLTTTSGRGRSTSQGLTYPVTAQTHPTVANGAWEREKDGEREKEGHTESIAMESAVPEDRGAVFDNMPELPKTRHTLPPVQGTYITCVKQSKGDQLNYTQDNYFFPSSKEKLPWVYT